MLIVYIEKCQFHQNQGIKSGDSGLGALFGCGFGLGLGFGASTASDTVMLSASSRNGIVFSTISITPGSKLTKEPMLHQASIPKRVVAVVSCLK